MNNSRKKDKVACILAAGTGSRLKSYTKNNTKCMISVGEHRLIDRLLSQIRNVNFTKIVIVVGYGADLLIEHIQKHFNTLPIIFVNNSDYAETNNIFSLQLALPELTSFSEVVIFESDVWISDAIAFNYLTNESLANHALVSPYEYWMDGTCALLDNEKAISAFISKKDIYRYKSNELYKTVNWYRFEGDYFYKYYIPFINAYIIANGKNSYYEDVLKVIVPFSPIKIYSHVIPPNSWMEIDDEEDLRRANIIAKTSPVEAAKELRAQYGGYWKNTTYEDLTLLENPYFPTAEFWMEFKEIIPIAACAYPSTQSVIANIYAKSANIESRHVIVGNGAGELMNALVNYDNRNYAIVAPYFLEYERILGSRLKVITRNFPEISLWESLNEWRTNPKENLILISPNNPTGECLTIKQIIELVKIGAEKKLNVVIDESFSDFSNVQNSLLSSEILDEYNNLIVIKSLGKSYGVGGVRLGVMCSTNTKFVEKIRNLLPIWNISSFAEVFLDLLPKYKIQFKISISKLIADRNFAENELKKMGVQYYPTQANFMLIRVKDEFEDDVDEIFFKKGFLVKTLKRSSMNGVFLRIAIKSKDTTNKVLKTIEDNLKYFMIVNNRKEIKK